MTEFSLDFVDLKANFPIKRRSKACASLTLKVGDKK
jgi:hypothetical protein